MVFGSSLFQPIKRANFCPRRNQNNAKGAPGSVRIPGSWLTWGCLFLFPVVDTNQSALVITPLATSLTSISSDILPLCPVLD